MHTKTFLHLFHLCPRCPQMQHTFFFSFRFWWWILSSSSSPEEFWKSLCRIEMSNYNKYIKMINSDISFIEIITSFLSVCCAPNDRVPSRSAFFSNTAGITSFWLVSDDIVLPESGLFSTWSPSLRRSTIWIKKNKEICIQTIAKKKEIPNEECTNDGTNNLPSAVFEALHLQILKKHRFANVLQASMS